MEKPNSSDQVLLVYAPEDIYALLAFQELLEQEGARVCRITLDATGADAALHQKALAHDGLLVVVLWSDRWTQASQIDAIGKALQRRRDLFAYPSIIVFILGESRPDTRIVPPGYASRDWEYSYLQSVQYILSQLTAWGWQRPAGPSAPAASPSSPAGIQQHIEGSRNIVAGRDINSGGPLKS